MDCHYGKCNLNAAVQSIRRPDSHPTILFSSTLAHPCPLSNKKKLKRSRITFSSVAHSNVAPSVSERQDLFNNIAPYYDQLNDYLSLGQHRVWKERTVSLSKSKPGDSVLDICCGSGDIALISAKVVGKAGQVTGLDFAAQQLEFAAKKQSALKLVSQVDMRWIQGDALDLPFEDSRFDAVTMGYGLRNVADIPKSLREVFRVLKPGKKAAILDFNNSTDPIVSSFQGYMLDNVVVPIARQLGLAAEYEYLRPSIQRFPTGKQQELLAKEAGFITAVHIEIGGGLMGILVVRKGP